MDYCCLLINNDPSHNFCISRKKNDKKFLQANMHDEFIEWLIFQWNLDCYLMIFSTILRSSINYFGAIAHWKLFDGAFKAPFFSLLSDDKTDQSSYFTPKKLKLKRSKTVEKNRRTQQKKWIEWLLNIEKLSRFNVSLLCVYWNKV